MGIMNEVLRKWNTIVNEMLKMYDGVVDTAILTHT